MLAGQTVPPAALEMIEGGAGQELRDYRPGDKQELSVKIRRQSLCQAVFRADNGVERQLMRNLKTSLFHFSTPICWRDDWQWW